MKLVHCPASQIIFSTGHYRLYERIHWIKGASKGSAGLQPLQTPQNPNLKNTDLVDIMISKVLRDFPFSRNQPLESADA
jgi:hypothetical protein